MHDFPIYIGKNEDGTKYEYIEESDCNRLQNTCPFCEADTKSGSWSPETCSECKAVFFFGRWFRDLPKKERLMKKIKRLVSK